MSHPALSDQWGTFGNWYISLDNIDISENANFYGEMQNNEKNEENK